MMKVLHALTFCAVACGQTPVSQTVTNEWVASAVDPTRLPLGDKFVTRNAPRRGYLLQCPTPPGPPVGASTAGPWIDLAAGTWDATKKLSVRGTISWPAAEYAESTANGVRTLVTNGLPVKTVTGEFPIGPGDPTYAYDRNPNSITAVALRFDLPTAPTARAPGCLPMGPVALLRNGVAMFAPVDEVGRDAAAWETQDTCQGHPQQQGEYHYHDVSSCLLDAAKGPSTVVGWAADGFPIVVERDARGALPSNADLDECHGRTSDIVLDGTIVRAQYHYSVTLEFPYVIGCFHAANVRPSIGR
jgi:hypothetical protein